MIVREFIELLEELPKDADVSFYNIRKGDDMYLQDISVSGYESEIFINIY